MQFILFTYVYPYIILYIYIIYIVYIFISHIHVYFTYTCICGPSVDIPSDGAMYIKQYIHIILYMQIVTVQVYCTCILYIPLMDVHLQKIINLYTYTLIHLYIYKPIHFTMVNHVAITWHLRDYEISLFIKIVAKAYHYSRHWYLQKQLLSEEIGPMLPLFIETVVK